MASPGLPLKSYFQFGLEATWATAATVNRKMTFEEESFEADAGLAEDPNLPGNSGFMVTDITGQVESFSGDLTHVLDYEGHCRWFDLGMGTTAFASYGATVTGSNPYTHVFVPREFFNSITGEINKGNIAATKIQQLLGGKSMGFTIKGTAGPGEAAYVRMSNKILGQQLVVDQNPTGALTAVSRIPVLMKHGTTIVDGSGDAAADVRLADFEFTYENGVVRRDFTGLTYTDEPLRGGLSKVVMKLTREYRTNTFITAYKAGTYVAPAVTFADGNGRSIKFELERARVMKCTANAGAGNGIMQQEIELQGTFGASSVFGAKVTIVNTQAAAAV